MQNLALQILHADLLDDYKTHVPENLQVAFASLHDAELSTPSFSFYTSVASVYSSKIEGEEVELDSYIKHKRFGEAFLPDYTRKIDDLYAAYTFAKTAELTKENIAHAHKLLSRHIVAKNRQENIERRTYMHPRRTAE